MYKKHILIFYKEIVNLLYNKISKINQIFN